MGLSLLTICLSCLLCSNPAEGGVFDFVNTAFGKVAEAVDTGVSAVINQWVDTVMDVVPIAMQNLGAGVIPINSTEFPLIHPSLRIDLRANISNMTLTGVDSFHRIGPAKVETDVKSTSAIVKFDAGINNIVFNASMRIITYFPVEPPIKISGKLGYGDARVVARIGQRYARPYAQLVAFNLTKMGNVTMKFEGLGPFLNGAIERITELSIEALNEPIRHEAEKVLREVITEIIEKPPEKVVKEKIEKTAAG